MHKNAIKKVGGVKISEISPQNEGFLDLNLWDFQHQGGDKNMGLKAISLVTNSGEKQKSFIFKHI